MSEKTTDKLNLEAQKIQKVQKNIKKSANILGREEQLLEALNKDMQKAPDNESINMYYSMTTHLLKNLKNITTAIDEPQSGIDQAVVDLEWNIKYLEWVANEYNKESAN